MTSESSSHRQLTPAAWRGLAAPDHGPISPKRLTGSKPGAPTGRASVQPVQRFATGSQKKTVSPW